MRRRRCRMVAVGYFVFVLTVFLINNKDAGGKIESDIDYVDWSFTRRVNCEALTLNTSTHQRKKIVLDCENNAGTIYYASARRNDPRDIFVIPFKHKCLQAAVNRNCYDGRPVPNVVHYVWFQNPKFGYFYFLSVMSAIRFISPCMILIHGDSIPYGQYWNYLVHVYPNFVMVKRSRPVKAGPTSDLAFIHHASDLMRLEAIMNYGGIYMDLDQIVLRKIDTLREYKHVQGHEGRGALASSFIIAERNSTFTQMWYSTYFYEYKSDWGTNALKLPSNISVKYPELIHTEDGKFTNPGPQKTDFVYKKNYNWTENYGLHFYKFAFNDTVSLDKIRTLNTTLGSVSRHILFGNKELCIPRNLR